MTSRIIQKAYTGLCIPIQYKILLLILYFIKMPAASAQEYSYAHYNTRDGLAGSVVYCMVQDHDGFMWFGTETGLSRFDGKNFKNFTTADGLPDNEILKLFVDSKNRIWIIPFNNAICYYWKGKIHTAENDSLLRQLKGTGKVQSVKENQRGEIAIHLLHSLKIIEPGGFVINVKTYEKDSCLYIQMGVNNNDNFEILGHKHTDKGMMMALAEVVNDSLVFNSVRGTYRNEGMNNTYISADLRISPYYDALNFNLLKAGRQFKIKTPDGFLNISRLSDSTVAISTSTQVQVFNFIKQEEEFVCREGKNFTEVMKDHEGNIWFASLGEGVYRLVSTEFKKLVFENGKNILPVTSVKKINDNLYIGTNNFMLWTLNTASGKLTSLKLRSGSTQQRIISIEKYDRETILTGTDQGIIKVKNNRVIDTSVNYGIKSLQVFNDTILMSSASIVAYFGNKLNILALVWGYRATVAYKTGGRIYIGTLGGLLCIDASGNIQHLGNLHKGLNRRIAALFEAGDGTLWIATNGEGIIGYKDGKVVSEITEKNGLTSNICRAIFYQNDILWVGTDKGLNKVEGLPGNYEITNYTRADGLIDNTVNALFSDSSYVYVGTPAGLSYFKEDNIKSHSACILQITGIQTPRRRYEYDTTDLNFAHSENNIRFEYAGISFKSAGDITYRYRLAGLDEDWQTTRENVLIYPTLPSGDYVLLLSATNKFGVESKMVSIRFTIEKLLWEKTWFRVAGLLFAGLLIWIFVHYRIKQIRAQEAVKTNTSKKISELEQMALKAQMNPHFIFNSLNSIQQYVIDKDFHATNRFITDFAQLVRLTLDLSSCNSINLQEEINYISTYLSLEQAKFENKFTYQVNADKRLDLTAHQVPPMILQPYIENSIQHGVRYRHDKNGRITINIRSNGQYIICSIEDNGIGRKASGLLKGRMNTRYQSKGMALTGRRIEMLNSNNKKPILISVEDLYDEQENPCGTKVTLKFPLTNTTEKLS